MRSIRVFRSTKQRIKQRAYFVIPSSSINRLSFVITIPSSHSNRHDSAGLSFCSFWPFM